MAPHLLGFPGEMRATDPRREAPVPTLALKGPRITHISRYKDFFFFFLSYKVFSKFKNWISTRSYGRGTCVCTRQPKVRVVCPERKPSLVEAWQPDGEGGAAFISVTNGHSLAEDQKISLPSSPWQAGLGGTPQCWPEVQGGKARCWEGWVPASQEAEARPHVLLFSPEDQPAFRPSAGKGFPLRKLTHGEWTAGRWGASGLGHAWLDLELLNI